MNIARKVLLGLAAVGIGGAGYVMGTLTRSQPTKATVEVEPTSYKSDHSTTHKIESNTDKSSSTNKTHKTKPADSSSNQTKDKTDDKAHKTTSNKTQAPTNSNQSKAKASTSTSASHHQTQLYLTGTKSNHEYSSDLIKRANQIYKNKPNLSFKQSLELARKELN